MGSEWKNTTIGDEVRLQRGFDITKLHQRPGHVPVVSTAGVLSFHDTAMAKGPGVVIGRKGNGIGRAHFIAEDYWPHDTTLWVTDFKDNDPKFVYYFFVQQFDRLQSMDVGSANPSLNRNHVHPLAVRWPPPDQQSQIARILGSLDDKIELNRRMNGTLEGMARALFQSWFVNFDPVRAKQQGRQPAGLDPATAELFPASFDDSPAGPIPAGWQSLRLREAADILSGGTPKKGTAAFWNGDLPWISPKAMTTIHVADSDDHVTEAAVGNGTRRVPAGTTLVMVRGMGLHQGVRITQARRDVTFNQDVKALVPKAVPGVVLLYAMLSAAPSLLSKVHAAGHGTGVLSTDVLQDVRIVTPPQPLHDRLAAQLSATNDLLAANEQQSRTLSALRDALLPKLLSGELSVSSASVAVAGAVG